MGYSLPHGVFSIFVEFQFLFTGCFNSLIRMFFSWCCNSGTKTLGSTPEIDPVNPVDPFRQFRLNNN